MTELAERKLYNLSSLTCRYRPLPAMCERPLSEQPIPALDHGVAVPQLLNYP